MNDALDWNDYRTVLRIAEAGSLSAAAQAMGSSHPTLFRRINAVEEKLGVRLFERFRTGYRLTAAGEEVAATARAIEELTNETERRVGGRDLRPSGVVRLATTDTLFSGLLAPEIARLRELEPGIVLEVAVSNEISDLAFREADIAIRPATAPPGHLVGRRLGRIRQAIYASQAVAVSETDELDWSTLPWIGPSASTPYPQLHAWMRTAGCDRACVSRMDSVLGMHAAVRAGIGIAVLPCYLAESDPAVRRLGGALEDLSVDLWLLTHPDLRHTARVRAVMDYIGSRQGAMARAIDGPDRSLGCGDQSSQCR
ncbi:LysR family transcriptional regulator [Roseivivax isoporae]|uniref:LysR family transcriptional regulator n=1 Tax=Roseivivax isoporae LMG 25204 TaxID=1449351 RepID=X7F2U6_9RHOB|nr:LysR family transcriptional regulator [Roseivivax isoporae]ETX27023.1 LysR family transcriptional regulator [Roseivivax isoporae LMG 25204]